MSYCTWHNYGYGIRVDDIKLDSVEKLKKFIAEAPEYEKEINGWLTDCKITEPTLDDYYEFDQDFYLGLASIIKYVLDEVTGLDFVACDDFNDEKFVIYMPDYPWFMSEKDIVLKEEDITNIFKKYISILTDDEIVIDYQEIENGG